jgi:hypothetical protein
VSDENREFPALFALEVALITAMGGLVASTDCGMKLKFSLWALTFIQASR